MATISTQKAALAKWTPVIAFDVTLKDTTPRYWAKQAVSFGGHSYIALVLEHSELRIEGNGVYGVDAVMEISLTLNNADANLNSIIVPANWQGGIIQPRFFFVNPDDGSTTTDSIVYPKFLIDLPTATWPRVEFSAHNKWNLARKMLPVSLVTKKDRYPFPDTAAERTAAGSDPSSEFFASGYDPATGKGNWKTPPSTPYTRADYDGTREKLKEIGLEVRFGGFGKAPPTIVGTPKKGEKADYIGNANEAKYGQAVPLLFGMCRTQPIVLDTGFPSAWNGSRLSHYLLSDGVNFGPEAIMGIEDVTDVFIPDSSKYHRIPETSSQPQVFGAWNFQGGYYGSQKAPGSSKYRNIVQATDFPTPASEHPNRDLYSGLAYLEVGFPKELSGEDGIGPKIECIVKGLKLEYWDSGGSSDWAWTDNPVWIFVHLLKLLRWTKAELDLPSIAAAAAYCEVVLASGKRRFRCNLPLTQQTRAADVLRGIRNNCRMYTSFAPDGKLQLKIAQNVAGEGGLAFALDGTNIMRGDDGQLQVTKFHRSIFEVANVFSVSFQNEDNFFNVDSVTKADVGNINQIDEKVSADSIFPILGIPSFDQAERQIEWMRQEQITQNEYYKVVCSLALIENKVGQIGTITEPRYGLAAQQVRIRAMAPGPEAGTVELTLQKHSDGAYTDLSVSTPTTRAQGDSSYTPRSVGGKFASSPAPVLTELIVAGPTGASTRRIRVEFKPPAISYEGVFSRETKISDVQVLTSGGSIPGGQVLFVEIAPVKASVRGLASDFLMVNVPAGGSSNSFTVKCQLPAEADQYILFVGELPGKTYEQTVAASPGTSEFTITVTNLNRNFGSIPPDPKFDHVHIFYRYNGSPDVLRDGGRTSAFDETLIEFEPELPAGNDTQVTVFVSSANEAEDDFYPILVSPSATITLTQESGKAMGWTATLLPGPTPSSVVAKFTRPTINGKRLFWVAAQVKDSGAGTWRELDDNAGAAVTYYDGSAISHESIGGIKIKKDPGQPVGFGTAHLDDLMMLDVAGGSFDKDRCQWGTVEQFLDDLGAPTTAANARYIALTGGLFRPQTTQDLRMKIVKPPHTWTGEGYLGDLTNESINGGVFFDWIGDREGDEFILKPVEIGRDIASVDVRFWIENDYCRSGGNGTHSTSAVRVRAARDDVIPGPVQSLVVTGGAGEFVAKWNDPLTGAATIDDVAIQWATDAGFTAIVGTAAGWGDVNRLSGTDPGKTYYWRLAAHNLSDKPSHASTAAALGATGWGPWTNYGTPTSVSSGNVGPADTVIPGPVQSLNVTGANGNFVADWLDPATGFTTIDDIAVEWATNPGFTVGVERAKGWGDVNHLQSTLPGKTYYFRVAAHNQSGQPSHSSTSATLGATGWGQWTAFGAPDAVSSGGVPGAPVDTVIPGAVVGLTVTGSNGDYVATWSDPTTGNLTIDDVAIQYTTDAAFTVNGPGSPAKGWGPVNLLKSTSPGTIYYFRVAVHNQSNQVSDASTATALGATGWGPWQAFGSPTAIPSGEIPIGDNTIPPDKFTGAARSEFVETFDDPIGDFWIKTGAGIITYPASGVDGGKVMRAESDVLFYSDAFRIPYDPRKLYRMTCRARLNLTTTPASTKFYMGVRLFNKSGSLEGVIYPVAKAFDTYPNWLPADQWHELTGWFKGTSATYFEPAPDAANPTPLLTNTAWISPQWAMNYPGPGSGNIMEIDDIRIEIFDEKIYESNAPNGIFSSLTKQVFYPYPTGLNETQTSAVAIYWDYTQGLVKAQQFAILVNDGMAQWVERVRALPGTGALRHAIAIYGFKYNVPVTINITAEAVEFGGQVPGPTATWGTFTPNANSGSDPGGWVSVGQLHWNGGNVWYDSIQYRNNIPPSNSPGAGIAITYTHSGSGASRASITGLNTYSQGTYFATHIAVLITAPDQTIVLNRDMVVTYISMASLPSAYEIPLSIPDAMSCRVTVAAIAETKNGRSFNSTFPAGAIKPSGRIVLQASNVAGSDKAVQIGRSGVATTEWTECHQVFQLHDVDNGVYRGRLWAQGTNISLQYATTNAIKIYGAYSPFNYSFGPYTSGAFGNATGAIAISDGGGWSAAGGNPSGGGLLMSFGGAGYWATSSGNLTNFAAAGPHCAKCGYDYWTVAAWTPKRKTALMICGWCGAVYKKGPKRILDLLSKQERSEIITKKNFHLYGMLKEKKGDKDHGPAKTRLRRRGTRRKRQPNQGRMRRIRSRKLRHGS